MNEGTANPWSHIPARDSRTLGRRVDPGHPLAFWYARDPDGAYLFVLTDLGMWSGGTELPRLHGIDVALRDADGVQSLVLRLQDMSDWELFKSICDDLLHATRGLQSTEAAGDLVIRRLWQWHRLLRAGKSGLLSEAEIIGLTGELLLLSKYLANAIGIEGAVDAWQRGKQDFNISETAIEVKTRLQTSRQAVEISSEEQLEPLSGKLVLNITTLGIGEDGMSLADLVTSVRNTAESTSPSCLTNLDEKLLESGYIERSEYTERKFVEVSSRFYEVREGFPRITPSDLHSGVTGVRYQVSIAACAPFEITSAL